MVCFHAPVPGSLKNGSLTTEVRMSKPNEVDSTLDTIKQHGIGALHVGDLTKSDLQHVEWAGGSLHLESIAKALDRAAAGEVEYLAVRAPDGQPISIGGIDYKAHEGAGTLWQLATRGELQGLGLGTRLIQEAEKRMRERGLDKAKIGVEDNNPRARALYERLGYRAFGRERASWPHQRDDGQIVMYETEVTILSKKLQ